MDDLKLHHFGTAQLVIAKTVLTEDEFIIIDIGDWLTPARVRISDANKELVQQLVKERS